MRMKTWTGTGKQRDINCTRMYIVMWKTKTLRSTSQLVSAVTREKQQNAQMIYIFSVCSTFMLHSCAVWWSSTTQRTH
jgi:magnesium-transporting ATPase (P-type)